MKLAVAHVRHSRSLLLAILTLLWFRAFRYRRPAQLGKPEGLYYKSWGIVIGVENYLLGAENPWRD